MIVEIRVKNCFAIKDQISFSIEADMRNKKFASNVHKENNFAVLKAVAIYGPNNSGKTCLIHCIRAIKNVLSNDTSFLPIKNIFNKSNICELGVTFLASGREFSYDFKYDMIKTIFVYEKFAEILKDGYGNVKENVWLIRDYGHDKYFCLDKEAELMMTYLAKDNLLCYLVNTDKFEHLRKIKEEFEYFSEKIDIIDLSTLDMEHTIKILKSNSPIKRKMVDFIKNADIYLENFEYLDHNKFHVLLNTMKPDSGKNPAELMEEVKLVSTYKGKQVPSAGFDSLGTKKIAALASYLMEGLEQGRTLIVDELDSSMHFKLTRAIVALFNNELNTDAQIIFTVHDVNLLDCKKLFRKEQIWFVHKDNDGVYVYSLADFTAKDGVRDTTDIIEKYRKGVLGALPEPDFINSLLSIKGNTEGGQRVDGK